MKVQKLITIDYELTEKLKQEDNASGLINNLLLDHYNENKTEEQILEETKTKIKEMKELVGRKERIAAAVKIRTKEMMKKKNGPK